MKTEKPNQNKLRVWHVPQIPMTPFTVPVGSPEEAVKIMDVLSMYDLFQLENNIKPDYCNTSGLEMYDESLTEQEMDEMGLNDRWVEWWDDDHDDINDYIASKE